jgi:hypothetical protein
LLRDGRLFITGGSEDGTNFKPVRHTLLVAPGAPLTRPKLSVTIETGGVISVTWTTTPGSVVVETSTNLVDWAVWPDTASVEGGRISFTVSMSEKAVFFRLRQSSP